MGVRWTTDEQIDCFSCFVNYLARSTSMKLIGNASHTRPNCIPNIVRNNPSPKRVTIAHKHLSLPSPALPRYPRVEPNSWVSQR